MGLLGGYQSLVVVLSGIAWGVEGVGPAEVDAVDIGEILAQEQPRAVALTLVLEFQVSRDITMKAFEDAAQGRSRRQPVQDPTLKASSSATSWLNNCAAMRWAD
jgi:hypothetical protein